MRYLKGGMADAQAVLTLQGIMLGVPEPTRDIKDGVVHPFRWQARYDDIRRAVSTARAEIVAQTEKAASSDVFGPDRIEQFRLDVMTAGTPPPQEFLLAPLMPVGKAGLLFGAGGIGKSLIALALCLLVALRAKFGEGGSEGFTILGGTVPAEAAGASVFLTLEDDTAEVHRRIVSLDPQGRRDGAPCFVIPGVDLMNFDPALVVPEGRLAALTSFAQDGLDSLLTSVAAQARCRVRLLVLDPAGDFLNADENDATFVKVLMRHLRTVAAKHGCTIILIGHVAKGLGVDNPTMRGSSAWIANSRFAYALWKPERREADRLASEVGGPAENLIWGSLVKANHADAPIGSRRLFIRTAAGPLQDCTGRLDSDGPTDEELRRLLVDACAECAAAGLPFTVTGMAGLFTGRADLPEPLATMARHPLEELGNEALDKGLLVKARTAQTQASPKFLDVPDGPLATGVPVEMFQGSRQEALARYREKKT